MAEVAASIAGLVSLSIQLLEKAESIRAFCNRTKAAPQTLLSLSERLETLSILLKQLAAYTQQDSSDAGLLERCVAQLRGATTQIERLLRGLDRWLSRTGIFGRVAVALRDSEIRGLLEEVEQAETSITLALLMFVSPRQTQQASQHFAAMYSQLNDIQSTMRSISASLNNDMQIKMLTGQSLVSMTGQRLLETDETTMPGTSSPIACQEQIAYDDTRISKRIPHSNRQLKKRAKTTRRISINLAWITGKVWQMAISQAEAGWDLRMRSWYLRSAGSEIFRHCRSGDVDAIRKLLSTGQASTYDYYDGRETDDPFECGEMNLLNLAAHKGNLDMCRFLLTETLLGYTGIAVLALNAYASAILVGLRTSTDRTAMYRLFFNNTDVETDLYQLHTGNVPYPLWLRHIPANDMLLQLVQTAELTDYKRWPIDLRIETTMEFHSDIQVVPNLVPSVVLQWIGETAWTEFIAKYRRTDGCTLLHLITKDVSILTGHERGVISDCLIDLLLLGADVCAIWQNQTPFMKFMGGGRHNARCCHFHLLSALGEDIALWQTILRRSGILFSKFLSTEHVASRGMGGMSIISRRYYSGEYLREEEFALKSWMFDQHRVEWDPEVYWTARIPVYQWYLVPGSWEQALPQIRTICWYPLEEDCLGTGHWVRSHDVLIDSDPFVLGRNPPELHERACYKLLMESQDDHGLIALRVNKLRPLPALRRSSSFASFTRPSCSRQDKEVRRLREWLPTAHVCPYDGRLRFRCKSNGSFTGAIQRDCYRGICSGCSLQESRDWRIGSFERHT